MSRIPPSNPPGGNGNKPDAIPLAPTGGSSSSSPIKPVAPAAPSLKPAVTPIKPAVPAGGGLKPASPAPSLKPAVPGIKPLAPAGSKPMTVVPPSKPAVVPAAGAPVSRPAVVPAAGAPAVKPAMPAAAPAAGAAAPVAAGGIPPLDQLQGRPIGRVLTKMGKITRDQLLEALAFQKTKGGLVGRILIDLGYVKEADLNVALAAQRGMEFIPSLEAVKISEETLKVLPAQVAITNKVLPLEYEEATKKLVVAIASHENFRALDDLRSLMGFNPVAKIVDAEQLEKALAKYYNTGAEGFGDVLNELSSLDAALAQLGTGDAFDLDTIREAADSNPVRKLINLVLLQAIKDKASDIHFEPFENEFKMRYRIDGVLYEMVPPPAHIAPAISSRIKVMANLDIAERRVPQDGRIELVVNNLPVDLRVSVLPTMFGESVVMRVLDRSNVALDVDKIGMRAEDLVTFRQLIHKPNGIVLVTGPTGSGKTTTLYSALRELNDISSKLITAEDPVEYDIDGIIQCQVKSDIEMTFGRILRSMLRQDPDVILVGEIRDKETAEIAVQASLTGHLVFSTLHTNDAPSAIARLVDLGLEPFLITATLEGILAQRLVRKICTNCKTAFTPTEEQLMELALRPEDVVGRSFHYGKGCENCNNTGYRGRMGIYEIMTLDDDIRDLVIQHASSQVLRVEARKRGMRSLRQSGLLAIYDGMTTIEEVVRETLMEEM